MYYYYKVYLNITVTVRANTLKYFTLFFYLFIKCHRKQRLFAMTYYINGLCHKG